eukprot:GFUD01004956.1.p1 GENE.GFUD01004956.1~~GFUD01004956.1.p1  ORF type:complete len:122 (+),score=33.29 GFUD01004956.1:49-414(+)
MASPRSVCDQCEKKFEDQRKHRAWTEIQEIQLNKTLQTKYKECDRQSPRSQSSTPSKIPSRLISPLLISQLNSAYRMSPPGSYLGVRPYNLPYSKAGRSMTEASGPRRYRIDHRFQSRFYK